MIFLKYYIIMICLIRQVSNRMCDKYSLRNSSHLFKEFVKEYNKKYKSQDEYETRYRYFIENLRHVIRKNCKSTDVEFGITNFLDFSLEELHTLLTIGLRTEARSMTYKNFFAQIDDREVPESWDWRDHNAVTRVRTQGRCGSCWAFVATGLLESRYAIKYKRLVPLSIQQLLDCSGERNDCVGGVPDEVLNKARFTGGIVSEQSYPYERRQRKCRLNMKDVELRIKDADLVYVPSEEHLKHLVYRHGPIIAGMKTGFGFASYTKGTVRPADINCKYRKKITHVVLIVGYGYDSQNVPYWLLKNSYGRKWGDEGYMRLIRGQRACNISDYLVDGNVK